MTELREKLLERKEHAGPAFPLSKYTWQAVSRGARLIIEFGQSRATCATRSIVSKTDVRLNHAKNPNFFRSLTNKKELKKFHI